MVYSTRRFVVCLSVCHFVLVFFSPFSIAVASFGGRGGRGGADLCAFRAFVRFVLVWICRFPLPLGVWKGLRFVIVALPGLFLIFFFFFINRKCRFLKRYTERSGNRFKSRYNEVILMILRTSVQLYKCQMYKTTTFYSEI